MGAIGRKGATPAFWGETLFIIINMMGALQSIPVAHSCLFTNLHFVGIIRAARQHPDSIREEGRAQAVMFGWWKALLSSLHLVCADGGANPPAKACSAAGLCPCALSGLWGAIGRNGGAICRGRNSPVAPGTLNHTHVLSHFVRPFWRAV